MRFRCPLCRATGVRERGDNRRRTVSHRFVRWLVSGEPLTSVARQCGVSRWTLWRQFRVRSPRAPHAVPVTLPVPVLVVDATTVVKRRTVALIAYASVARTPVHWRFAARESYRSWHDCFVFLKVRGVIPSFVVCDGQKGLLGAVRAVWPEVRIQRCVAHIIRQSLAWLTRSPKTPAGRQLRRIVRALGRIRTARQQQQWEARYARWTQRYDSFLRERTLHPTNPRHWWYTHRKLRAARSLLSNALPHLFTYIAYPFVPRTTNQVEGGINAPLKELFRNHRGLSPERKTTLVGWYLYTRQRRSLHTKKPTRNAT